MNDTVDNPKYIKNGMGGIGYKIEKIKIRIKKIDYSKLKRKLYQYILTIVMAAVVFVLFVRLFIQGTLGGVDRTFFGKTVII